MRRRALSSESLLCRVERLSALPRSVSADQAASAPASVGAWFATVEPPPPAALAVRLAQLLAPYAALPVAELPESCLHAGEKLLKGLLASGSTSRGTALDLLAVDALVTYAFQAAADEPARIEARAARAMAGIALLPNARPG